MRLCEVRFAQSDAFDMMLLYFHALQLYLIIVNCETHNLYIFIILLFIIQV